MLGTSKRSASHAGRLELELLEFFPLLLQSYLESQIGRLPSMCPLCYRSYTNASRDSANACSITNDHTNACSITNDHTDPSGLAD